MDQEAGATLSVSGHATGSFGSGTATGHVHLHPAAGTTLVVWRYDAMVTGPVTFAGPLLLRLSATAFAVRVFKRFRSIVEMDTTNSSGHRQSFIK